MSEGCAVVLALRFFFLLVLCFASLCQCLSLCRKPPSGSFQGRGKWNPLL